MTQRPTDAPGGPGSPDRPDHPDSPAREERRDLPARSARPHPAASGAAGAGGPAGRSGERGRRSESESVGRFGEPGRSESELPGQFGETGQPQPEPVGRSGESGRSESEPVGRSGEPGHPESEPAAQSGEPARSGPFGQARLPGQSGEPAPSGRPGQSSRAVRAGDPGRSGAAVRSAAAELSGSPDLPRLVDPPGSAGPQDAYALPGPPDPRRVDPAVLGALLRRHGWRRRGGAPGRYGRWTPPGPGAGRTSLLVPESRAFPDSEDLVAEALAALARGVAPSGREILLALAVPSDEIRWWRDTTAEPAGPAAWTAGATSWTAGAAPWTAGDRLRSAARQTLLAAALATRARAGYHGARHRRPAAAALEEILVGPDADDHRLTAFVPVGTGRPLAVRLHQSLCAAREAIDYQRATGGMDAFDAAVEAGVSHELTEALITLVGGAEGAGVTVAWAPAAGVPEGCSGTGEPVEFSPGDLPVLREAGARYQREEPSVPVRITGAVVRMRRDEPRGEGKVRLRVLAGAEVTQVRATLDEDAYRIAGQAHLVGLPVRMHGRLESRGGFRRLTGAAGVAPVQVDDAERDRLMKALQENLDCFEEACGGDDD